MDVSTWQNCLLRRLQRGFRRELAGAYGNRTHQEPVSRPLTGFEDRAGHQPRTRSPQGLHSHRARTIPSSAPKCLRSRGGTGKIRFEVRDRALIRSISHKHCRRHDEE